MKITKSQLKEIIKEELGTLTEAGANMWAHTYRYSDWARGIGMGSTVAYVELSPEMYELDERKEHKLTEQGEAYLAKTAGYESIGQGVIIESKEVLGLPKIIPLGGA